MDVQSCCEYTDGSIWLELLDRLNGRLNDLGKAMPHSATDK